jgi:hypothetical protein
VAAPPTDPQPDLVVAHDALHARLEELAWAALEALVRQQLEAAAGSWRAFAVLLQEHMALEDGRVLPAYRPLAPAEGPGRLDHVEGDHTILLRHVAAIDALLGQLQQLGAQSAAALPLRSILQELPVFYRLLGTLEHHAARERQHVYPALARALPPEDLRALSTALTAAAA